MSELKTFSDNAKSLSKSPLGVITLFLILVYSFACIVTTFGDSFAPNEKTLLVYFIVFFPVLVLLIFTWLVMYHNNKLFGPNDFKNEANYLKTQMISAASLSVASSNKNSKNIDISEIVRTISNTKSLTKNPSNKILWVDDNPENNTYERKAFEAIGFQFTLALNTKSAIKHITENQFTSIISDFNREGEIEAGYKLLTEVRNLNTNIPFFIYAGSNKPEHKLEAKRRGAQGSTNDPQELFMMVTKTIISNQ